MALPNQAVIPATNGKPLRVAVSEALSQARSSGKPIDPETPLYLQDVRIYKDGTFKGQTNTKQDIRKLIQTTLQVNKEIGFLPFSKIDHNTYEQYLANPWASMYPYALGDIDLNSLREQDGYLISNFFIPYSVAGLIERGRLRSVSVEIIPDQINPLNGKKYPDFLKAVALLGKDLEALYMVLNQYNDTSTRTIKLNNSKVFCYQLGDNNMDMNAQMLSFMNAVCNKLGIAMPSGQDPNNPNNNPDGNVVEDDSNIDGEPESVTDDNNDNTNDMDYLKQPDAMAPQAPPVPAQGNAVNSFVNSLKALLGIQVQPTVPDQPLPTTPTPVPQGNPSFPPRHSGMAYSAKDIISEDKNEMSTTPNPEKPIDQEALRKSIESELELKFKAQLDAKEAELNKLSGVVLGLVEDKQMLTTKEYVYSLKNDTDGILLLPAIEQDTIDIIASMSPVKEKHFSAGAEVEDSPQERTKAYISKLVKLYQPYVKAFSMTEQGKVRQPTANELGSNGASRVTNADPASELTHDRVLQYAAKNNLVLNSPDNVTNATNYRAALAAVSMMENSN